MHLIGRSVQTLRRLELVGDDRWAEALGALPLHRRLVRRLPTPPFAWPHFSPPGASASADPSVRPSSLIQRCVPRYMSTDSQKTPLDALAPDYDRHPKFGKAKCADVTVAAGEMVYYPSFWWHQTQVRLLLVARRSVQMSRQVVSSGYLERCVVCRGSAWTRQR